MNFQEICLAFLSILVSVVIICAVIAIGWYIVWKIFLSRFKLVRELLGLINDSPTSSSSPLSAAAATAATKHQHDHNGVRASFYATAAANKSRNRSRRD